MTRIIRLLSPLAIVLSATLLAEAGTPAVPNPLQGMNPQTADTIRNMWMLRAMQGRGRRGPQTGVANPFIDGTPQLEYPQYPDSSGYPATSSSGSSSSKDKRAEARRLKEERKRQARADKEAGKDKAKPARTANGKIIHAPNPAIPAAAPKGKANKDPQNP